MLTDTQRSLFREILDTKWEFEQEKDWSKKIEIAK